MLCRHGYAASIQAEAENEDQKGHRATSAQDIEAKAILPLNLGSTLPPNRFRPPRDFGAVA